MKHLLQKQLLPLYIVLILYIVSHIPFLTLYPAEDTATYAGGAIAMYLNNLNPFSFFYSYKPPVQFLLVASLFKLFGPYAIVMNCVVYLFSLLVLVGTYMLGETLRNKRVGLYATILLACSPLFLVESFSYTDAVFTGTFMIFSWYFYLKKKTVFHCIASTLLVLTKEPYVLMPFVFFTLSYFQLKGKTISVRLKQSVPYILPLLIFAGWMVGNKITFGWFLWSTNIKIFTQPFRLQELMFSLNDFITHNAMFIVIPTIAVGLYRMRKKKHIKSTTIIVSWIGITCLYLLFHYPAYVPRYLIPLYPLLYIIFSNYIDSFIHKRIMQYICIGGMVLILIISNIYQFVNGKPDRWFAADGLSVIPAEQLHQKVIAYLWNRFPNYLYVTTQPYYPVFDPNTGKYHHNDIPESEYWDCNEEYNVQEQVAYIKNVMIESHHVGIVFVHPNQNQGCKTMPEPMAFDTEIRVKTPLKDFYQDVSTITIK